MHAGVQMPIPQSDKAILSIDDVAQILDCSRSHVSNLLSGRVPGVPPIPHIRAGRLRRVRREALMEWFRQQETA
jgi:excisionase family DNA binding protein